MCEFILFLAFLPCAGVVTASELGLKIFYVICLS